MLTIPNQAFTVSFKWFTSNSQKIMKPDFDADSWMTSNPIRIGRKEVMESDENLIYFFEL